MASTTDKRRALAALAAERAGQGRAGRFWRRFLAVLVLLLLVSLPCLWVLGIFSTPQALAEVKQLVDRQVAEYDRVACGQVPYASAPTSSELFAKVRELPPGYREQAGRQMGRLSAARERAEIGSYFALPPERRQEELDRRLRDEADRRARWQAEREKRDQERAARSRQADDGGGRGNASGGPQGGSGMAAGGGGPPGGGPRGSTEEARLERSKRRLDRTTPQERAQQAEYRRALDARRNQMGLPSGGGGRRG